MKNDITNIPIHIHISDSNLLQYEFHHIAIKFYYKIFPWDFKINLRQLLLEDKNLKNFLQPENSSENSGLQQFFPNFSGNCILINFLTKTRKCLICWLLWIQNYQITGNYLTSNTTFPKKSNSYEISNTDIYIGEDLEFIIHVFYWCIQLDHEIY